MHTRCAYCGGKFGRLQQAIVYKSVLLTDGDRFNGVGFLKIEFAHDLDRPLQLLKS
jgi:hypothetical protein